MTQITNKLGIFYITFELAFRCGLLAYILKIIKYNTSNLFKTPSLQGFTYITCFYRLNHF
jgi:hypothetical protein